MKKVLLFLFLVSTTFGATQYQKDVLNLMNRERKARGMEPLKLDETLNKLAIMKSNDMVKNKYFSHTSPVYGTPYDMLKKYNVQFMAAAENIAAGQRDPKTVMRSWMSSSGHRKNILNPRYTKVGIGKDSSNSSVWTEIFIGN